MSSRKKEIRDICIFYRDDATNATSRPWRRRGKNTNYRLTSTQRPAWEAVIWSLYMAEHTAAGR